jgi:lipid A ethanolaminephosphotransferase
LTQSYVFHSVLNFLSIQSPVYDEQMNIFKWLLLPDLFLKN